jgi:hypothetical protein
LATQEASCRAYALEHGYVVTTVQTDVHTGADLFQRDGLSALRAAVRRRRSTWSWPTRSTDSAVTKTT